MDKKIKSISEILLFPFIFSMFNPAYSLAMSGKEVFDSIQSNNGIKKEDINNQFFDKLVDSCIKDYLEKINYYIPELEDYQRSYINGIIGESKEFKENLV